MAAAGCRGWIQALVALSLVVLWGAPQAQAQTGQGRVGQRRGGQVTFEPRGPGVFFDALDPTVKRWYVPQELYHDYGFQTWEYSNYAREQYERYVTTTLEGEYFYDQFGSFVNRGWLIYDWRQEALTPLGSGIYQDSRYQSWFSQVLIASDAKGGTYYAMTVGDQIRTTLTPMTFHKPAFDGIQIDVATDKYAGSVLLSRISGPVRGSVLKADARTNASSLVGGRGTAQVGDFLTLGATFLNAHNTRTTLGAFDSNPMKGTLGDGQAEVPLTAIALVLSDDSPEDGEGGAALFAHDLVVLREDFQTGARTTLRLADLTNDPTRWPIIEGGFQEEGFLEANGIQRIILNYDFTDPAYTGPDPTEIVQVAFDLVLANDYRVEVWSDRQTGQAAMPEAPLTRERLDEARPVLLEVARASGNVKDGSNRRRVTFEYGLPTASQVYGLTLEAKDVLGFSFYGEYDVNQRYRQYPNLALFTDDRQLEDASSRSDAWMMNLSSDRYPWFLFGEAFSMDHDYSTSPYLLNSNGHILYDQPSEALYEFVEDNDDQDRYPDWQRSNQIGPDFSVFPGWDENNDFVNDFNQNDTRTIGNRLPDYEEPFLRYHVDRPVFLYGIDLNNNGWIDRFENDDEPDYPYDRDHRGYNAYVGRYVVPELRATVGQTRERLLSSARRNHTTYGLVTADKDFAGTGRLRAFGMVSRAKDNIPDDRREPQPFLLAGPPARVADIMPAQDTWVSSVYVGFDYTGIRNLGFRNKAKYDRYAQQRDDLRAPNRTPLDDHSSFFGIINKADYTLDLKALTLQPRVKSQYSRRKPFLRGEADVKEWEGTWSTIAMFPVLSRSKVEVGAEFRQLRELERNEDQMLRDSVLGETGDANELNVALQWSTSSDYLGYRVLVQSGFRLTRNSVEAIGMKDLVVSRGSETETNSTTFITIYAGVEQ
ncbi:MAG: hypothetical protein AB1505_28455 [Candidatus Latescibacterota bacterium]